MSVYTKRSDVVSYGIAPNNYSSKNLESSGLLNQKHQDFGREGIEIAEHLVFSVPSSTFTNSTNQPSYYPPDSEYGDKPDISLRISLWELFGRVGYRALNENHMTQVTEESNETNNVSDDVASTCAPPYVYKNINGDLQHDETSFANALLTSNFNNFSQAQKQQVIQQNPSIRIFDSQEEYMTAMNTWREENADTVVDSDSKKGGFHVLIEFFRGETEAEFCSGYRIWILKEKGVEGNLSQIMGDVIASANEKPKNAKKDWKNSYDAQWRKIDSNSQLKRYAGNSLYLNKNHFTGNENACPLTDPKNPIYPKDIFSVGGWLSILYGSEENSINSLPTLYPNLDIDKERFKYQNYFSQNMKFFKPATKFRESMYYCLATDLEEDVFMAKYRLNEYVDNIYPMIRDTFGQISQPKQVKADRYVEENNYVAADDDNAWKRRSIRPASEAFLEGQSIGFKRPLTESMLNNDGIVLKMGESDFFLTLRAMSAQHIGPEALRKLAVCKTVEERRDVRLSALRKAILFSRPLFEGNGNANVSMGLRGIINCHKQLKRSGFSHIFIEIPKLHKSMHFQDNFMAYLLDGFEHYLHLSTLQCHLYSLLLNMQCAYTLKKNKTHIKFRGKHGGGKSEAMVQAARMKCRGVCTLETNTSMLAHLFGDHQTFAICMRHEPDPMKKGGKGSTGNLAAQQKMELEKSMLSEQQGRKTTTVFNKELNKFVQVTLDVILSKEVVEAGNYAEHNEDPSLNNRMFQQQIMKMHRSIKNVGYMQSAMGSMDNLQLKEQTKFISSGLWIDSCIGKTCAMTDMMGGLAEPLMDILNDVLEHLQKSLAISFNARAVNRCRNNAQAQIYYDALNILFFSVPTKKHCVFYIGTELVPDTPSEVDTNVKFSKLTRKNLLAMYEDEEETILNTTVFCMLYRKANGQLSCSEQGNTPVQCKVDLIYNTIFSIEGTNEVLEDTPLVRRWEYLDAWNEQNEYKKDDVATLHFKGRNANFKSFYETYTFKLESNMYSICPNCDRVYDFTDNLKCCKEVNCKQESLLQEDNFIVDINKLALKRSLNSAVRESCQQLNVRNASELDGATCKYILTSIQYEMDILSSDSTCKTILINLYEELNSYQRIFEQIWNIKIVDGKTQIPESFLGKYKDEELSFRGNDRSVEMWHNINLLSYCTVDVAIRTACLMRDEFLPEYADKVRLAIAEIGFKKLSNFNKRKPFKHFMPLNDQQITNTADDVDLNYISLDFISQFKIEIQEQVKGKLKAGMKVELNDMMIDDMILHLGTTEFANVRYKEQSKAIVTKISSSGDYIFEEFNASAVTENLPLNSAQRLTPWKRNHERNMAPIVCPVIRKKKQTLYIHVAWISDLLNLVSGHDKKMEDSFLQSVSRYKYPGRKGEVKRILTGHAWTGKVNNIKNQLIDHCEPPVSQYVEVKADPHSFRTSEKKNLLSSNSHRLHGRKKKRLKSRIEVIEMSFDRHIACKRARQLDEYEGNLHKDLYKDFLHLSKEDLLEEANNDEQNKPILEPSFDYPDQWVQDEYDFRVKKRIFQERNIAAHQVQNWWKFYTVLKKKARVEAKLRIHIKDTPFNTEANFANLCLYLKRRLAIENSNMEIE